MAETKVPKIDAATAVVAGVEVRRWWSSVEIWAYILNAFVSLNGLVLVLAGVALPFLPTLGLTPYQLLTWTLILNAALTVGGGIKKITGKTVIAGATAVAEAKATKESLEPE